VDTGITVNPDTVVAQLEGGLIFGLTAAMFGEIKAQRRWVASARLVRRWPRQRLATRSNFQPPE
jgi:CO/xanthine dehydrogenase Mo-binding subunit